MGPLAMTILSLAGCDTGPGIARDAGGCALDGDAMAEAGTCSADAAPDVDASADTNDASDDAADPSGCDPLGDPQASPCALTETYGVFVAGSGADDASGTSAAPLRTIAEGLAQALRQGKSRVFVCQGHYGESVGLGGAQGDISLYGGLGCIGGWSWTGGAVDIAAPISLPALRIASTTTPITVEDVSLTASDAVGQDASGAGNSAVAAWVEGANVTFRRVTLFVGKGADGAAGKSGASIPNYPVDQPAAPPGLPFSYSPFVLGAGGVNACVYDAASSQGGVGGAPGDRSMLAGYPGGAGGAAPSASLALLSTLYNGVGGVPSPDCQPGTGIGNPGANGLPGASGAMATSYGTLFPDAWEPSAGQFGGNGLPGQGGGGGAGQPFGPSSAIFGGQGGGAGGCGGTGGAGGQGGGASFALVSLQSSVAIYASTLISSDGGQGGPGGAGQVGQAGGLGGAGSCPGAGGAGGNGAGGSGGGGGTGGLSVGIAYEGTLPTYDTNTTIVFGASGPEGVGGAPGAYAVTPGQIGLAGAPGAYGRGGLAAAVANL
ncbi:MAG TPA: hypothetical protein VGM06_13210 [Polyangiaceae bacterium]